MRGKEIERYNEADGERERAIVSLLLCECVWDPQYLGYLAKFVIIDLLRSVLSSYFAFLLSGKVPRRELQEDY